MARLLRPKSQKARGIMHLSGVPFGQPIPGRAYKAQALCDEGQALKAFQSALSIYKSTIMARPCPLRPRHGFVDSGEVTSGTELAKLAARVIAIEEEAELVLCPLIPATASAVINDGAITLGPDHDGATSGRNSIAFHFHSGAPLLNQALLEDAGITDAAYLESVWGADGTQFIVQLRDGPKLPKCQDYIPAPLVITEVVRAEGDLVLWESRAQSFQPGTVVHAPGGSLASHYGVHCLLNKVPYVVSWEPQVGEVLEPTPDIVFKMNHDAFREGLECGLSATCNQASTMKTELAKATFFGLHHFSANPPKVGSFMAGFASASMAKLLMAACLGELRHVSSVAVDELGRHPIHMKALRDQAWAIPRLEQAFYAFHAPDSPGGVGGAAWCEATRVTMLLLSRIADYLEGDNASNGSIISTAHGALNLAHNNGWLLNKFTQKTTMDAIAAGAPEECIASARSLYSFWAQGRPEAVSVIRFVDPRFTTEALDKRRIISRIEVWPKTREVLACLPGRQQSMVDISPIFDKIMKVVTDNKGPMNTEFKLHCMCRPPSFSSPMLGVTSFPAVLMEQIVRLATKEVIKNGF